MGLEGRSRKSRRIGQRVAGRRLRNTSPTCSDASSPVTPSTASTSFCRGLGRPLAKEPPHRAKGGGTTLTYDANFYTDGAVQAYASAAFRTTSSAGQLECSNYTNSSIGNRPTYGGSSIASFLGLAYLAAIEAETSFSGTFCQWFGGVQSGLTYSWRC